jgi:hypothetical protein
MAHPARRVMPNGPVGRKLQHFKCTSPCRHTFTSLPNGYWVWYPLAPRSQTRHTQHHNFGYTSTLTAAKLRTCISWRLSPDGAHLHAHRSLRYTTSNGYWVWHPSSRFQTTDHTRQHPHPLRATQTSTAATTTCQGYLHVHT